MIYENICYFLPLKEVKPKLGLDGGQDAGGYYAGHFRGLWGLVLVELHPYPISENRAWLPHQHEYAGKMGTRIQARAERYVDLMQFKLYLRSKIDDRFRVPG